MITFLLAFFQLPKMDEVDWLALPKEVLNIIFRNLSLKDIGPAALVCKSWQSCLMDQVLWKHYFSRDVKNVREKASLFAGVESWYDEYRQIVDNVPNTVSQTLTLHRDEVLHVAFSNDGDDLVSCSKDAKMIVWKLDPRDGAYKFFEAHDMSEFDWLHTWSSQFNSTDEKVLVSGVIDRTSGEIAVFTTGRASSASSSSYQFVCRVVNDPYDVMGCWFTEDYFLAGSTAYIEIDDVEVITWLYAASETESKKLISVSNIIRDLVRFEDDVSTPYIMRHFWLTNPNNLIPGLELRPFPPLPLSTALSGLGPGDLWPETFIPGPSDPLHARRGRSWYLQPRPVSHISLRGRSPRAPSGRLPADRPLCARDLGAVAEVAGEGHQLPRSHRQHGYPQRRAGVAVRQCARVAGRREAHEIERAPDLQPDRRPRHRPPNPGGHPGAGKIEGLTQDLSCDASLRFSADVPRAHRLHLVRGDVLPLHGHLGDVLDERV